MLNHESPHLMTSAEKKRLRDRRAQQTLRDKKVRHAQQLEEKVAYCEQHHSDQGVQRLLQVIHCLRRENEFLRSRQAQLSGLVKSWDVEPMTSPSNLDATAGAVVQPAKDLTNGHNGISMLRGRPETTTIDFILSNDTNICNSASPRTTTTPSSIPDPSSPASLQAWKLLPLNTDDPSIPTTVHCPWFAYPEHIVSSPPTPSSPLEILYGSRTNRLADMIYARLRYRPLRDPECLALGWIVYHMTKWMFCPSPTSYGLLPDYLKPVAGQLEVPHPMSLDLIVWPTLRMNMIRQWEILEKERDDLFGLFCCCVKVRWPWGKSILERDERDGLRIRKEFYETFMKEEGWGLTGEFLAMYPNVTAGMDVASVLYEVV